MPRGVYLIDTGTGPGVREEFSCAPGPAGWRYVAQRSDGVRVDLTLRADGRPHRLEVRCAGTVLRGGAAGPDLLWTRSPDRAGPQTDFEREPEMEPGVNPAPLETRAAGFTGPSPAFWVATARLLGGPGPRTVPLAAVALPALSVLLVRERWTRTAVAAHPTDLGPLELHTWQVTDPDTGAVRTVHLAGDVVVAADGVELLDLDSPPHRG